MKKSSLLILAVGVFSILNTEMGVVGILPAISEQYGVNLTTAGLLVSMFALAIALSGPVMPMLLSRFARKKIMVFVLGLFTVCNVAAAFAVNFPMLLLARVIPAFFHPVYVSFALAAAADFAEQESDVPKAVSKVMVGVSAGMVLGAPVAGLIANWSGIRLSLLFFAAVNLISFLATIFFHPGIFKSGKGFLRRTASSAERKETVAFFSRGSGIKRINFWCIQLCVQLSRRCPEPSSPDGKRSTFCIWSDEYCGEYHCRERLVE